MANRALLVCNSTYAGDPRELARLRGPEADGRLLWQALTNEETGVFATDDVRVLQEQDAHHLMRATEDFFASAGAEDVLLFYFSGHGWSRNQRLFLCARDTEVNRLHSTALADHTIGEVVDASSARAKILVLDCCYSGAFKGNLAIERFAGKGRFVLAATSPTQLAKDADVDGQPSPFTRLLINGLASGATDSDSDGNVDLDDLYAYLVRESSSGPKPHRKFDGSGNITIARRRSATPDSTDQPARSSMPDDSEITHDEPEAVEVASPPQNGYLDGLSMIRSFNPDRVVRFRAGIRREIADEMPEQLSSTEFLQRAGLMRAGRLTYSGVLLFGEQPTAVLPSAIVQCARFYGDTKDSAVDKRDLRGTVPEQIADARDFIADLARRGDAPTTETAYAEPVYLYPMIAVREIIANAVVHRDYEYGDKCVHVHMYTDRIEVLNPGTWAGYPPVPDRECGISVLECHSSRRNFRLASVLTWSKLVEGEGTGIRRAIDDCLRCGAPEPSVVQVGGFVMVTIYPGGPVAAGEPAHEVHARSGGSRPQPIYRLLGQLVIGAGGAALALPNGHRLTVLATLLINANHRVSTTDLLRAAWGNPDVDETQLHKCVSHLRSLLETIGRRKDLKTWVRYGYELRVAEDDVDALIFRRLLREAEEADAERRLDDEVRLLREALELWQGPEPLAGVPTDSLKAEVANLKQSRKRAAVRLFDLELSQGRPQAILGDLHTMVRCYPTDRRLTEQLMLALYRSGHATEAIDAYVRHAAVLQEKTGAEPESGLRDLMYAISSDDEATIIRYEAGAEQVAAPVAAPPAVVPRQLPPDTTDFVGRNDLVAEAKWLLGREPDWVTTVLVVTGPGGIGKTALAVHVAHQVRNRYPDGQLFVALHGTTAHPVDTAEVLAQLIRSLGVGIVPDGYDERTGLYRTLLGERHVLLVLDDARDEAQIRDLIPGNPACDVLVTSRGRLPGIGGAHHLPTLQPLDLNSATDLFHRIVDRSGVDPYAEPEATRRVVELCAGLPLALYLAAALRARARHGSTAEIADRLAKQSLSGFVYGDRSTERSIGAGFDRLDPDAQQLFLGLGLVQVQDFGLWTAAAVLGPTHPDPAEVLLRLAGCHMIQPTGTGLRYRFHELTREYARRRAEGQYSVQERQTVTEHVYGALLTLARRAHFGLYHGDFDVVHGNTPTWDAPDAVLAELDRNPMDWFEAERHNIRAAVRHCADLGLAEICWDLAVSTHEFYSTRGYLDDWHATHLFALDACRQAGNLRGEAVVVAVLGQPLLAASRRAGVPELSDLTRAAAMLERLGDRHGQAIAVRTLASGLQRRGQLDRALELFGDALTLYQACDDVVGAWQTMRYIGQTHLDLGHPDEALRVLHAAQDAGRDFGQPRLMAQTALHLGRVHLARGDLDDARGDFQFVIDTVDDGDEAGHAYASHGLGHVAVLAGELDDAQHHLSTAVTLARRTADAVLEGRVHQVFAQLHRAHGEPDEEISALRRAVHCFASRNATYSQAEALTVLGETYARRGANEAARSAWTDAHRFYREMGRPEADRVQQYLDELPG